ncbi:MAG: hypothetical protein JXR96_02470 [Deltaproteobacteria bacterium]|nr:hypothetical protein [Deltaproteobacteria bacterium]
MRSMQRFLCAAALLSAAACSGPMKLVRVAEPMRTQDKPEIDRVIDLGGQVLPAQGEIRISDSDGKLSPGEWVAVRGKGMDADSRILLGERELAPEGYLAHGLLFRVPRGLDPRNTSQLKVRSARGESMKSVRLRSYAAVADRRNAALRFAVVGFKGLEGTVISRDFACAGPVAFSPDGALLYALGRGQGDDGAKAWAESLLKSAALPPKRAELPVQVFAMGAKGGPRKIAECRAGLDSAPAAMLAPAPGQLLVLSEGHLLWLDVSSPEAAAERGRLDLRQADRRTCFASLTALAPDRIALLDPCTNQLRTVELGSGGPALQGEPLELAPDSDLPLSLSLAAEPGDPQTLWVLQGPNFRIAREEAVRGLAALKSSAVGLLAPLTGKAPEGGVDQPRRSAVASRLLKLRVTRAGSEIAAELGMPARFFPLSMIPLGEGKVAVGGVSGQVFDFAGIEPTLGGMKKLVKLLLGVTDLGRVYTLAEGAEPEERLKGLALYFQLAPVGDSLLISVLRPAVKKLPPKVDVRWGVEMGTRFSSFKSLDYKSLLPPYVFEPMQFQ